MGFRKPALGAVAVGAKTWDMRVATPANLRECAVGSVVCGWEKGFACDYRVVARRWYPTPGAAWSALNAVGCASRPFPRVAFPQPPATEAEADRLYGQFCARERWIGVGVVLLGVEPVRCAVHENGGRVVHGDLPPYALEWIAGGLVPATPFVKSLRAADS